MVSEESDVLFQKRVAQIWIKHFVYKIYSVPPAHLHFAISLSWSLLLYQGTEYCDKMASGGMVLVKYLLFFFNFIFWVSGMNLLVSWLCSWIEVLYFTLFCIAHTFYRRFSYLRFVRGFISLQAEKTSYFRFLNTMYPICTSDKS